MIVHNIQMALSFLQHANPTRRIYKTMIRSVYGRPAAFGEFLSGFIDKWSSYVLGPSDPDTISVKVLGPLDYRSN